MGWKERERRGGGQDGPFVGAGGTRHTILGGRKGKKGKQKLGGTWPAKEKGRWHTRKNREMEAYRLQQLILHRS